MIYVYRVQYVSGFQPVLTLYLILVISQAEVDLKLPIYQPGAFGFALRLMTVLPSDAGQF